MSTIDINKGNNNRKQLHRDIIREITSTDRRFGGISIY